MGQHYNGNGRDIHKKGMGVEVKPSGTPDQALRNLDSAMKLLKRRLIQEGVIRDMRKNEFAVTRGQKRRKAKQEAIRRTKRKARQPA